MDVISNVPRIELNRSIHCIMFCLPVGRSTRCRNKFSRNSHIGSADEYDTDKLRLIGDRERERLRSSYDRIICAYESDRTWTIGIILLSFSEHPPCIELNRSELRIMFCLPISRTTRRRYIRLRGRRKVAVRQKCHGQSLAHITLCYVMLCSLGNNLLIFLSTRLFELIEFNDHLASNTIGVYISSCSVRQLLALWTAAGAAAGWRYGFGPKGRDAWQ